MEFRGSAGMMATRIRRAAATVAAALLMLVQPALGQAQETDAPSGEGFFSIGVQHADIEDLNHQLDGMGYPTFDRTMLAIGGGGYTVRDGGLMLGGEGYGLLTGENSVQSRSVSLGGGHGFFTIGYLRKLSPTLEVYPMIGLGGGGMRMAIGPQAAPDSFDDVLEDPDRQVAMHRGGLLLSLGGGVTHRFGDEPGGLTLGVRAGYVLEPYSVAWRMDGNVVSDGPDAAMAGPFLRVTLGHRK